MKVWLINLFFLVMNFSDSESILKENYIGMNKNEIISIIKTNHRKLKLNTTNTNDVYNYLKFEDRLNQITVLFFLSEDDKCKMVRIMCDYSNINIMLNDLNNNYKQISKNTWSYYDSGKVFSVKMEEGDWFFTITIKEK